MSLASPPFPRPSLPFHFLMHLARCLRFCAPFALVLSTGFGQARPLPFRDGTAFTAQVSEGEQTWFVRHAVIRNVAPGLLWSRFEAPGSGDAEALVPHLTWLAHRVNGRGYQANVYLAGGAAFYRQQGSSDTGTWWNFQADAESRRWYGMVAAKQWWSPDRFTRSEYTARAGWAPYLGGYHDLNTWFMLETAYSPRASRTTVVKPLVRFFYHNGLLELGSTLQGSPFVNLSFEFKF